ncbi:PSPA7_2676 family Cys-rich small protein [Pseudomonas sp. R5(2019)]|uniref:PSPA7_2676 family Cys-rich small protein n=1 Tax=Pseudomonas sp. R5(2019) TaxID=2697566 RepID=UPI00273CF84E|nr:PSPA7_2676 family Cys-rich small protein [Pseudomonas sp. R5(2019)]
MYAHRLEASMTFICFFTGCVWSCLSPTDSAGAPMLCERCIRCGAQRYRMLR